MASILRSCHAECQRKCAMLRCFNKSARQNSPCSACCRQKRDKIRPARLAVVKTKTKFALHASKYAKKRPFRASWANFVPNMRCPGSCLGEFFHGTVAGRAVLGEYFRANRHCAGLGSSSAPSHVGTGGGLPPARPLCTVSPACPDPRVVQFPAA